MIDARWRVSYRSAAVLACVLSILFTMVSLAVPPSIFYDPSVGMIEWRCILNGGPANSIQTVDSRDISQDAFERLTWWSPGQYVVPGLLATTGLRWGSTFSVIAGISLLSALLGWLSLAKFFGITPQMATLGVFCQATIRYSTYPFRTYNGGEVLLHALTPWLILLGIRLPTINPGAAAGLAFLAILAGFFMKLTGVLVTATALVSGAAVYLIRHRRLTFSMLAGAAGSVIAAGILYITWFARGSTPASANSAFTFSWNKQGWALASPWSASVSWMDLLSWLLCNPSRPIVRDPVQLVWLMFVPAVFFAAILWTGWRANPKHPSKLRELLENTAVYYVIYVFVLAILLERGSAISVEDRHYRSSGMLIFALILAACDSLPKRSLGRLATFAFCGVMSIYGLVSFISGTGSARPEDVDSYTRIRLADIDMKAVRYARAVFDREGRDSLFFVSSAQMILPFPLRARVIGWEFEKESTVASRNYYGRVRGNVYVLIPNRILQSTNPELFLKAFHDYSPGSWRKQEIGETTAFIQGPGSREIAVSFP